MLAVGTNGDGRPAVCGELDLASVRELESFLARLDGDVDLSGVTFFDATALRTFLVARRHNPNLRVINPSPSVMKVLEITGMLDYLTAALRSTGSDTPAATPIARRRYCRTYDQSAASPLRGAIAAWHRQSKSIAYPRASARSSRASRATALPLDVFKCFGEPRKRATSRSVNSQV